jgi:hypothetical protein
MPTLMIHHTTRDTFTACVYFGLPPAHSKFNRQDMHEISEYEAALPLEDLLKAWLASREQRKARVAELMAEARAKPPQPALPPGVQL